LYARFLHPVFGFMTECRGCTPHYDCSAFTESGYTMPDMQWGAGDAEEEVLMYSCKTYLYIRYWIHLMEQVGIPPQMLLRLGCEC